MIALFKGNWDKEGGASAALAETANRRRPQQLYWAESLNRSLNVLASARNEATARHRPIFF